MTGSAVPAKMKEISHTGTGRISRMKMRPMSLFESEDSNGTVSLQDLFEQNNIAAENSIDIEKFAFLICRGGCIRPYRLRMQIFLYQYYFPQLYYFVQINLVKKQCH